MLLVPRNFSRWARALGSLALLLAASAPVSAACTPSPQELCLLGSRFRVSIHWETPAAGSGQGEGFAIPLSDRTGAFWFFQPENYEVLVKVLDGRELNDSFWVFFGALTDVRFKMTVTDTETGLVKTYENPAGHTYGVTDTGAFPPRGAFCGGIGGFPCPAGQACDLDPGVCGITDPGGRCVELPQACAAVFMPVCGCDGSTYPNDCERLRAGVPRAHDGPCFPGS